MAAILNSAILNLAILDSATLVFPLKLTHTCQDWFPPFAQKILHSFILSQLDDGSHLEFYFCWIKKYFTHSFWLNLMMAAILNSAMLDLDTLFSSLRFTQKHSHSTLTLTQTNLIWLKLIHCHSTWWLQPSWILAMLDSAILVFPSQTDSHLPRLVPTICTKTPSLILSDSTWWWQPSWILPSWILPSWIQQFCTKLWTQTNSIWLTHSFWLNLMMAAILNSSLLD